MATQLIEFENGPLVEVEVQADQVQEVSGRFAQRVGETFDKIRPLILTACRPVVSACQELNQEMDIDEAEVELGLSFEGEGNLYITKSTAGANLKVRLLLKPKKIETPNVSSSD